MEILQNFVAFSEVRWTAGESEPSPCYNYWPHCDKARATLASSSCCGVHNTYISTFISRQTQFSPKFLLRMFYQLLCSFYLINCTGERLYDWGNFFLQKMTLYATRGSYAKLNYAKIDVINFINIRPIIFDFLPNIKQHFHLSSDIVRKPQNLKKSQIFLWNHLVTSLQSGRFLKNCVASLELSVFY